MNLRFESVLEKLGRILAAQYGIEVLFEGNQAYTDGKKIVLPYFPTISDELKADLNGFLDHEVAHCKFTNFDEVKKVTNRFHKELLNATEDVRIEREMIADLPGTAFNLGPLNEKCRGKMDEGWDELPWPIRTIMAIRDIMEGRAPRIDKDIEKYVDLVKDAAIQLRKCKNTEEIRVLTEEIVKKIVDFREEEKSKGPGEDDKKKKEKGDKKEKSEGGPGEGDGESDEETESDGDEDDKEEKDEKKDSKKDSKSGGKEPESKKSDTKEDKMLKEKVDSKESEYDKHIKSVHDMVDAEIKKEGKALENKTPPPPRIGEIRDPMWEGKFSIPTTTRYDKVTDHSAKGNGTAYAKAKREIMPLVAPIKSQLERILKVKENAKWTPERERGGLDSRALSKLASQPGYRTVFREYTKTETNNVAVEILVDMSGSMSGRMETAKKAAIAMSEALKDLQIPFEVTGFTSVYDEKVAKFTATLGDIETRGRYDDSRGGRFNRFAERLDLHVFKSFDCNVLTGIEKMFVGSNNPDGECVVWAAKRLANRKEKRKILMVLSDGQPAADGNNAVLCSDLKNRVKQIEASGIECIGIGIQTDSPKHFYKDFVLIENIEDLPKTTMKKLSQLIVRGG